jgi:hypothetical protein
MLRRSAHRPEEPSPERADGAVPPPSASVLDLQRSAGNAAVSRVLARQPVGAPLAGPSLAPVWTPPTLPLMVEAAVDDWLKDQRAILTMDIAQGRVSMPEIVDRVRRSVSAAASASPEAIRWRVNAIYGAVPETRGKPTLGGQKAEMESKIANLFPKVPTSVTFGGGTQSLTLGINGAEIKLPGTTYKATPGGPSVEIKEGEAKTTVSGSWDGKSFGIKTDVQGVKLEGKVKRDGEKWTWSAGLTLPLAGEEVDEYPDLEKVVTDTHAAVSETVGYVRGGGNPTDAYVRDRLGKIKPAIDAAGRVAKRASKPSATLRVTTSGDNTGGWMVGVSVVVEF